MEQRSEAPRTTDQLPVEHLSAREGYDRWASIYDQENNPLITLEEPRFAELLGDVRGLRIVDLGAGTGRHSLKCLALGADVTAVDFSTQMLARAAQKSGGHLRLLEHDLGHPLPLAEASFDRVLCGLVLEHIADLPLLFREMRRLCKPDGFVVVSAMHPAMVLRGISARFTDPETQRETRPQSHPHQISDFVMAAVHAGLRIDHLSEHAVDEALTARSPRAGKYLGWPLLVIMRLRP